MQELYNQIAKIGKKYNAVKIVLFGSRARGDHRERSDIDLAVYGVGEKDQGLFSDDIDHLPTLLNFDLVFVSDRTDARLLANIERDGKVIMDKFTEKKEKLVNAVARLEEALGVYEELPNTAVRDGVIQRFEFCTELAWKATREYLIDQGYVDINSPKSVMRHAYADGLVNDEQAWIDLLTARNTTSHVYDDDTAADVFKKIKTVYLGLFKDLIQKLK